MASGAIGGEASDSPPRQRQTSGGSRAQRQRRGLAEISPNRPCSRRCRGSKLPLAHFGVPAVDCTTPQRRGLAPVRSKPARLELRRHALGHVEVAECIAVWSLAQLFTVGSATRRSYRQTVVSLRIISRGNLVRLRLTFREIDRLYHKNDRLSSNPAACSGISRHK